jgi:hypothetical protein
VVSLVLPQIAAQFSRQITHALGLALGAAGLISLQFVHDRYTLMLSMVGVGCAWACMHAMPYAMLVGALPDKKSGIYMGIFNFFIVLPQIVASLGLSWLMEHWLNNDRLLAVVLGGGFMLLGSLITLRVQERNGAPAPGTEPADAPYPAQTIPNTMQTLTFNNRDQMPMLGLGTWKSKPGEVYEAVKAAIRFGYRHIDCARIYGNEAEIGKALAESFQAGVVTRQDLWITSKLWNDSHHPGDVQAGLEATLKDLQLEYLDLFLMHWPVALQKGPVSR